MKRLRIREEIPVATRSIGRYTSTDAFTWGDVKKELETTNLTLNDSDILICGLEEGYEYNNSSDEVSYAPDHYSISIVRYRDETDEEMDKRAASIKRVKDVGKGIRYKQYLKLKQEFEPEGTTTGD